VQRKKILLVAPVLTIGGAEKVVRDIAWYADPQQYEMHLLILKDAVGIYETQLLERGVPYRIRCQTALTLLDLEVLDRKDQEQAMLALLTGKPTQGEAEPDARDALWQCRIGGDGHEA